MTQNAVFVVAGKDQGGMWNLIFSQESEKRVELTEQMTNKFVEITVLAVTSHGVTDKAAVKIEHNKCDEKNEEVEEKRTEEIRNPSSSSITSFTSETFYLSSFIIFIAIFITVFYISKILKRSSKHLCLAGSHVTEDAFLADKDNLEFDDIKCNKEIYVFLE